MIIKDISTQLIYTTVPIVMRKKMSSSIATAFIFSIINSNDTFMPFVVTNSHVLEESEEGYFEMNLLENGKPSNKTIKVSFDDKILKNNKLGNLDLVVIPLAGTLRDAVLKNINLFYRMIDKNIIPSVEQLEDLSAMEDIVFIGYPNGFYDNVNKIPIMRKGITATPIWNNFQGKEEFLIDAGVFPGSSGSPVFIYNESSYHDKKGITIGKRLLFVGIISGTTVNRTDNTYLNLGVVINSQAFIRELTKFIEEKQ